MNDKGHELAGHCFHLKSSVAAITDSGVSCTTTYVCCWCGENLTLQGCAAKHGEKHGE